MDIPSAEMVKYAANAMLATKISFINEIANLCEKYNADVDEVRRGMCSDRRIGNQFLYPGLGYGGSCFPKDVLACIAMGETSDHPAWLLEAVHKVNQHQRTMFVQKFADHFGGVDRLKGKRFAVWGIAFKPGTDDVREAPSITIIEHLLEQGAEVVAYDPVAHETAHRLLDDRITYARTAVEALDGADALVVCTDWDEFKVPEFEEMAQRMKGRVVFDGRNIYRRSQMREHGFAYHCVGRDPVTHSA
jgi:UDPglucose 6-dehydrogenase